MKKSQALKILNERKNTLLKKYPNLPEWLQKHNGYIAGGYWVDALLNKVAKDIDVYFSSVNGAQNFYTEIQPMIWIADNKSNLRVKQFELMRFITYPSAMDCINDFDFSCCQIAWDGVTFYFGEHTLKDIHTKYLRLLDLHAPLVPTLNRISKYIEKGFKPDEHTFGTICKWIKQNGGADNVPMKFEAYLDEAEPKNGNPQRADFDRLVMEAVQAEAQIINAQRAPHIPAGNIFGRLFGWIAF